MIAMGSEPIPLPYRSWDEVPLTIVSINSEATNDVPTYTNSTTAPDQNWKKKTIIGIKHGTIVAIILFLLKFILRIIWNVIIRLYRNSIIQYTTRRPSSRLVPDFRSIEKFNRTMLNQLPKSWKPNFD